MSEPSQRIVFNNATSSSTSPESKLGIAPAAQTAAANGSAVYLYADDPLIQLEPFAYDEAERPRRVPSQLARLQEKNITVDDPIFDSAIDWPFREFKVFVQGGASDTAADPGDTRPGVVLGFDPPQPRRTPQPDAGSAGGPTETRICLFSVIVALEWQPTAKYVQQLKWAFRAASDFLYDVTDGYFAFGQVLIGGPELMDCADVQILASNRLLPRSWVSGLHEDRKYMPIRVGRGIWHKNNRVSIPWDEPEAYRTLIHEWAHYALELRDAYLETHYVSVGAPHNHAHDADYVLLRGEHPLVIPQISITTESIMASLEGTSELVPQMGSKAAGQPESPWEEIRKRNRYRNLGFNPNSRTLEGPGRLPLPLPVIHLTEELKQAQQAWPPTDAILNDFPKGVQFDHCWAYVIKGSLSAPLGLVAQGSIDARASQRGFRLLGVAVDNTVVLIGRDHSDHSIVVAGRIDTIETPEGERDAVVKIGEWTNVTPEHFPLVDVVPSEDLRDNGQMAKIAVNVSGDDSRAWIFPLGYGEPEQIDAKEFREVPTLDGHVLVTWDDGKKLVISSFSQGGNPQTGTPTGGPPITAGSSEGNSMLFFADKNLIRDYSSTKIVTTLIHTAAELDQLPDGAQARGYAFSLSCNTALPTELDPTLILYFDRDSVNDGGDLVIYRQDDLAGTKWTQIATYQPKNSFFVAAPLNAETAERLVANDPAARIERYRLYWKPRAGQTSGSSVEMIR
ncbi:MAG TPA: hypothetical protein VGD58_31375 [Herpetosiphonaceae bacterium]